MGNVFEQLETEIDLDRARANIGAELLHLPVSSIYNK